MAFLQFESNGSIIAETRAEGSRPRLGEHVAIKGVRYRVERIESVYTHAPEEVMPDYHHLDKITVTVVPV